MGHISGIRGTIMTTPGCPAALRSWFGRLVFAWLFCMTLDYGIGTVVTLRVREWSSKVVRNDLWRKLGTVMAALAATVLNGVVGLTLANIPTPEMSFRYEVFVSVLVPVWYIMTELGDVVENTGALGASVSAWPHKAITVLEPVADGARDKLSGGDQRGSK